MSLWETIEKKYFKKQDATIREAAATSTITPQLILHVHSKMRNKGIFYDS